MKGDNEMSEYFIGVTNLLMDGISNNTKMNVAVVNNDNRNIHFVANDRKSRNINVYTITSINDINDYVQLISQDLTGHVYHA